MIRSRYEYRVPLRLLQSSAANPGQSYSVLCPAPATSTETHPGKEDRLLKLDDHVSVRLATSVVLHTDTDTLLKGQETKQVKEGIYGLGRELSS